VSTYVRLRPDEVLADAVVVTIWNSMGRPQADLLCPALPNVSNTNIAELPQPVPVMLQRAEEVRRRLNLSHVAVA